MQQPSFPSTMQREIRDRFGFVPAMFSLPGLSAPVVEGLWQFARTSYLDLPLPSLLKERLCVVLAREAGCRYGFMRHVAFLLGYGHPAGDRECPGQSEAEVLALLRATPYSQGELGAAIRLLEDSAGAPLPAPGEPLEAALFQCCIAIGLRPGDAQTAQAALRKAFGDAHTEYLLALLTYLRAADAWNRMHPEAGYEPDLREMLSACPDVAAFLTERDAGKARSRAARANDVQESQFIARLSHDLRNPVAAISAVSDMFQVVGVNDERLRHACGILQRQTQHLGSLLDDLSDSANLALGRVSIDRKPVRVGDVLTRVLDDFAPQMRERGIAATLRAQLQDACVLGSEARLVQAFRGVVDAIVQRAVTSSEVVLSAVANRGTVRIMIAAGREGALIKQSHPHHDGVLLTSMRDEDPGLSLSTARVIAELHGGSLQALSCAPGGLCFQVTLPLEAGSDAQPAQDDVPPRREKARTRVLAIEDNRDFAQLFRHMLEIMGCELDITSDAGIGLSIARDIQPELIFCDLGLPGDMDGFGFARAVRAAPDLAHIPLVAVSGYNSPEDRQRALDAGFDRICGKPVKFADISAALATFSRDARTDR